MKKIIGFFKNNHYKRITLLSHVYAGYYRFLIKFRPMKKLEKKLGVRGEEAPQEATAEQIQIIRVIKAKVNGICSKTPWESKCFVRALTAQKLLKYYKIPSTLFLGVARDPESGNLQAHAWIQAGGWNVTGGNGGDFLRFAVVSKFRA